MNRSIERRAFLRRDVLSVFRWQSHGEPICGHRNETLTALVRLELRTRQLADADRENLTIHLQAPCPPVPAAVR